MKTVLCFMSMLTAAQLSVVELAARPETTVTIRTYNYAGLAPEQLAAATSETEHIFKNAGIAIEWIACRVPGDIAGAACIEPLLAGRDLMLRLVDRVPVHGERGPQRGGRVGVPERIVALGESMFDREQRGGVLMTVDLFPVRTIAGRASTGVPTLLGRAIAHEIGHLLLGSAEHPRLGLMRALWSHDELRGLKPAHWGFSAREAAQMRRTRLRAVSHVASAPQAAP